MAACHDQDGLWFEYPENWHVERSEHEDSLQVALHSPDTAFLTISVVRDLVAPEQLADMILHAMREEFADLESEPTSGSFAGHAAVGYDVHFFQLDLTNSGFIRSFLTELGPVAVLGQATDSEEVNWQVLWAVCRSLRFSGDGPA